MLQKRALGLVLGCFLLLPCAAVVHAHDANNDNDAEGGAAAAAQPRLEPGGGSVRNALIALRDAESYAAAVQARSALLLGPLNTLLEQDRDNNLPLAHHNYNIVARQVNRLLADKRHEFLQLPLNFPGDLDDVFVLPELLGVAMG